MVQGNFMESIKEEPNVPDFLKESTEERLGTYIKAYEILAEYVHKLPQATKLEIDERLREVFE